MAAFSSGRQPGDRGGGDASIRAPKGRQYAYPNTHGASADDLDFSDDGDSLIARSNSERFAVTIWGREAEGGWSPLSDAGIDELEGFPLGDDEAETLADRVHVTDDGVTHLPNPLNPDDPLTWPTPLVCMDGLDAIYLAENSPYVVAHQCNRLEVMEVVP